MAAGGTFRVQGWTIVPGPDGRMPKRPLKPIDWAKYRALHGHRQGYYGVDAGGVVGLVEPPPSPGLLRDGGGDLEV